MLHASSSVVSNAKVFNVPNVLTSIRLVLAIAMFVALSLPGKHYLPALLLFLVAASTDWLDGYWARRFGQITQVGRIFDPFVDKTIICGAFIFLAAEPNSGIDAWMAVVVVSRELLVTALRSFLEQQGADFSASFSGKLKMLLQCAAVTASLLSLYLAAGAPSWIATIGWAFVWASVLSTIQSGVEYIFAAYRLMRPASPVN